jgi:3-hydroxybutyryl-CoA dehydrogenase
LTIPEINTVSFIGAGTMGCANSLVAAVSGYNVVIYDVSSESLGQVTDKHREMGKYLVASGYCTAEELEASAVRISCTEDLHVAVDNADLVSESVIEDLRVKREVHGQLDKLCPADTILTTNTSGFLVSDIEDVVGHGDRFAALHSHYGSPLIDIVRGPRTSPETIEVLERYVRSLNCVPLVLHRENRGYVLNALLGPVLTVALILLVNGIADKERIDAAWMKYRRAPMGPFGMMDLFGLNVVYDGWQHRESDPRIAELKPMVDALLGSFLEKGELGVKTGKGFYKYPDPAFEQPAFVDAQEDISVPHYAMTMTLVGNAILLASNDIASPEEIDRAWTVGMTLDTGPFALLEEMGAVAFLQLLGSDANTFLPADTEIIEQYLARSTGVSDGGN